MLRHHRRCDGALIGRVDRWSQLCVGRSLPGDRGLWQSDQRNNCDKYGSSARFSAHNRPQILYNIYTRFMSLGRNACKHSVIKAYERIFLIHQFNYYIRVVIKNRKIPDYL